MRRTRLSTFVRMTTEDASIGVQLVDDDELEILEQLGPARMMRKDSRVHHVRVAEDDVRTAADGAPGVLRRIAVVCEDADFELASARQLIGEPCNSAS